MNELKLMLALQTASAILNNAIAQLQANSVLIYGTSLHDINHVSVTLANMAHQIHEHQSETT